MLVTVGHAADEEERGEHHADGDRNRQVDEHGEAERREQNGDVALWRAQLAAKGSPFTHVVRNDDEDRRKRRKWNQRSVATEEERDEQQRERVGDAGDRRSSAVLDVRRRSRDRAGGRNAAEERRCHVGDTLRNQFHVRAMTAADHPVGDDGGEQ